MRTTIKRIVDQFVRSEYFATWQAERIESGGYARPCSDARDRFDRCYAAAEDGADGSTHRECIDDMRSAFADYLRDRRRASRLRFAEFPYRVQEAVDRHFDALETWHEKNGSLDQQIG